MRRGGGGFDGVDSELRRFIKDGGWEEDLGVGIFVHIPAEGRGFLVACSGGSLAVQTMDV